MLSKHTMGVSNKAGVHGTLYGAWWCHPPGGARSNTPKAQTILRYYKQYIANSGLIYTRQVTQNRQITTTKDKVKDCQLEDEEIIFVLLSK